MRARGFSFHMNFFSDKWFMQTFIWHTSPRLFQQVACPTTQPKVQKSRHPANPKPHAGSVCSGLKIRWARDRGPWIKETQVMGHWNNCFRLKLLSGKLGAGKVWTFKLGQVDSSPGVLCRIVQIKKTLATEARVKGAYVRLIGSLELGSGRSTQEVQNISWNGSWDWRLWTVWCVGMLGSTYSLID